MPERLRINSSHLCRILEKITDSNRSDFAYSFTAPVLLRPLRILVYYEQAIRELYKKLENKFENGPSLTEHSETSPDPADDSKAVDDGAQEKPLNLELPSKREAEEGKEVDEDEDKNEDDTESSVAFEHLKLLVEFMGKDMQNRISHLESGRCQKVVFSDLWYLFQPGGLVVRNDGKQAYRILSMHSVGHRVTDPLDKWYRRLLPKDEDEEEEDEAPITINCVHVDFDGKKLGPVSKVFRISRFEREKQSHLLRYNPSDFTHSGKTVLLTTQLTPASGSGNTSLTEEECSSRWLLYIWRLSSPCTICWSRLADPGRDREPGCGGLRGRLWDRGAYRQGLETPA